MGNAPVFAKLAYVSNAVRFRKITVFFQAQVVLKQLVSLIGCLVACSARTSVDTHTHTDKPTILTLTAHARQGLVRITRELRKHT